MANEPVPSYVADLLYLTIASMKAMSRASILKVPVGVLELTLSFKSIGIGKLEWPLASKNSVFTQLRGSFSESSVFFEWWKMRLASFWSKVEVKGLRLVS